MFADFPQITECHRLFVFVLQIFTVFLCDAKILANCDNKPAALTLPRCLYFHLLQIALDIEHEAKYQNSYLDGMVSKL